MVFKIPNKPVLILLNFWVLLIYIIITLNLKFHLEMEILIKKTLLELLKKEVYLPPYPLLKSMIFMVNLKNTISKLLEDLSMLIDYSKDSLRMISYLKLNGTKL